MPSFLDFIHSNIYEPDYVVVVDDSLLEKHHTEIEKLKEQVKIDDIIKLCNNNIGNKYIMPIKSIKVYIKKGKIYFLKLEN